MIKKDLKIGDILYHTPEGDVKITKLGNKYLEIGMLDGSLSYFSRNKYYIETLALVTEYGCGARTLYLNKQEFLDEKERNELYKKIKNYFAYHTTNENFTLDQLRRINLILEEKNEQTNKI